jgi:hypothetical protein
LLFSCLLLVLAALDDSLVAGLDVGVPMDAPNGSQTPGHPDVLPGTAKAPRHMLLDGE